MRRRGEGDEEDKIQSVIIRARELDIKDDNKGSWRECRKRRKKRKGGEREDWRIRRSTGRVRRKGRRTRRGRGENKKGEEGNKNRRRKEERFETKKKD